MITSKEVVSLFERAIQASQRRAELAAILEERRGAFEELGSSRRAVMSDRDRDREAVSAITSLLIGLEQYEAATEIFNNFINRSPKFSQEVADLILKSPRIFNNNVT